MKKLILMLCLLAGFSGMANAQLTNKSPEQRAAHRTKALQKKLNLSQEQATTVQAAFLTQATRMDSLKNSPATDKKSKQLAARSIMLNTKKKIVAVLNDEQKQKFVAWEKARKERQKGKQMRKDTQEG
ncbi:hypothetical protein KXD93_29265 [Mucilaginibacter sp. BJC16-A38]|uniref:hypothetical protein n=1 Tax=Mucilaginibacter phenanthrenivorans TaxID=1234842 RepID=UPI002157A6B1|nr:hypothetical protein [Mucilaginibacter phenanthrenivorans]MCR8561782.1 hypothetical protein [Mucilaginibacter phenanthrenivorans]